MRKMWMSQRLSRTAAGNGLHSFRAKGGSLLSSPRQPPDPDPLQRGAESLRRTSPPSAATRIDVTVPLNCNEEPFGNNCDQFERKRKIGDFFCEAYQILALLRVILRGFSYAFFREKTAIRRGERICRDRRRQVPSGTIGKIFPAFRFSLSASSVTGKLTRDRRDLFYFHGNSEGDIYRQKRSFRWATS